MHQGDADGKAKRHKDRSGHGSTMQSRKVDRRASRSRADRQRAAGTPRRREVRS